MRVCVCGYVRVCTCVFVRTNLCYLSLVLTVARSFSRARSNFLSPSPSLPHTLPLSLAHTHTNNTVSLSCGRTSTQTHTLWLSLSLALSKSSFPNLTSSRSFQQLARANFVPNRCCCKSSSFSLSLAHTISHKHTPRACAKN